RDAVGPATAWSPKDALVVQANVSDPLGSSEIAGARINLTAPSGARIANYTAMALFATDPASPSAWKVFRFTLFPPLAQGSYHAVVTARESNGVLDIAEASALVRAPSFTLAKTTTSSNVNSGDRYTYDLWFNNTGSGPAGRVSPGRVEGVPLPPLTAPRPGLLPRRRAREGIERGLGYRGGVRPGPRPVLHARQDDDELERQQRGPVHVRSVVQQHGLRTRGPGLDQRQPTERTHVLGILRPRGHDGQLQLDVDRPGSRELSPQHRRPSEGRDSAGPVLPEHRVPQLHGREGLLLADEGRLRGRRVQRPCDQPHEVVDQDARPFEGDDRVPNHDTEYRGSRQGPLGERHGPR